jgi:2-methylcitrate dehydratase PrpD
MSSSNSITSRIAEWTAGLTYEDVPRRVVEEAKNQILSMIAAVHAGHFSDAGRCISRTVKEWTGGKEATLIPSGERTAVHYAIVGNAALASALDYDDYLLGARTGCSAVLTTLALAEKLGSSGQEFLLAQVLANEVCGRAGLATGLGPFDDQSNSFVHLLGSAIIAAKLLKLDRQQTAHALGIAMLQPNFLLPAGFYGSEAKLLSAALIAPIGVQAAELAANGVRGGHEIFEGERGFLRVFAQPPLPGAFKGYGKVWLTESLGYKIYPGCVYLGSIIDCVLGLVRQHHLDPRKVHTVYVGAGPHTLAMDGRSAPYIQGPDSLATTLHYSVAYNVAVALMDRELSPRQFTRDRIKDAAVWELAGKVRLSLDADLERRGSERSPLRAAGGDGATAHLFDLETIDLVGFKTTFGARVRIELDGGRNFEMEQESPSGSGARPFDDRRKAVEDKFRRETRYTLRKERMEKAIDIVHHLDESSASHIRELARLCCSEKA